MKTELSNPVQYFLPLDDSEIKMNPLVGRSISMTYQGEIHCVNCGNKTNKSYNQGHCYPCFMKLASCDMCILKPETCHFEKGTCREPDWAEENCFQHHYVYIANTSGIKVGITRESQVPTRWMDQGATQALKIFQVDNRLQSGLIEVQLKKFISDRTDWRKMLKGNADDIDLYAMRDQLYEQGLKSVKAIQKKAGEDAIRFLENESIVEIVYPVDQFPEKVKSLNFDKQSEITGKLMGLKGQYLILDSGVLNMRKFAGYNISFQAG